MRMGEYLKFGYYILKKKRKDLCQYQHRPEEGIRLTPWKPPEAPSSPLELALWAVVSHSKWVLETEFGRAILLSLKLTDILPTSAS